MKKIILLTALIGLFGLGCWADEWTPTPTQSNLLYRANDLGELMGPDDVALFWSTNPPPSEYLTVGVWPLPPGDPTPKPETRSGPPPFPTFLSTNISPIPTNHPPPRTAENTSTNASGPKLSFRKTASPVPDEVLALPGYQLGMPYAMRFTSISTNYSLLIGVNQGFIAKKPPPKLMEFEIEFYNDLTKEPIGKIKAIHNGQQGFMKTDMHPIPEP